MKLLSLSLVLILSVFHSPAAFSSGSFSHPEAIKLVIQAQLNAFQADDNDKAYEYSSPAVKEIFPDVQKFIEMVKTGYKPVYRPKSVEFKELIPDDVLPIQHLIIIGPDGRVWDAYYAMMRQEGDMWKVAGVKLFPRNESTI